MQTDQQSLLKKSLLLGTVGLLLSLPAAWAAQGASTAGPPGQGAAPPPLEHSAGASPGFSALDSDGDRRITPQEAKAAPRLARYFDIADRNHDGAIERSEFSAFENEFQAYHSQRPSQGRSTAQERPGFKPSKTPKGGLLPPDAAVDPERQSGH